MTFGVNGVVVKKDKILLIKRRDIKIWALPGGIIETNESLEDAVVREIREETNVHSIPVRMTGIYLRTIPKFEDVLVVFRCRYLSSNIRISQESIDVGWFSINEALQIVPGFVQTIIQDAFKEDKRPSLKKLNNYELNVLINFITFKIRKITLGFFGS